MKAISAFEDYSAEYGATLKRGDSLVKAISAFEGCFAKCGPTLEGRFTGEGDLRL